MQPYLPFSQIPDSPEQPALRVGPAGWSYNDWKGIVYPPGRKRGFDPLRYLSQFFDTIEINSTFYRPMPPETFRNWADRTRENPRFRFSVKCWQRFTHERGTVRAEDLKTVLPGLECLKAEGKLGCILFQFPWSFRNSQENRSYLAEIRASFSGFPIAAEIRHASWNRPGFFTFLESNELGFVNLDQPELKDNLPPTQETTAPHAYVRLHGRNREDWFRREAGRDDRYNYLYTHDELAGWAERIRTLKKTAREIYVITNNHFRGQAVCNAFQLQALLGRPPPWIPDSMKNAFPELEALC